MDLSLPPEASYASYDDLLAAAQEHAKRAGYAFTGGRSCKRKGGYIRKELICDKGGKFTPTINEDYRKRQRMSKKTQCPCSVYARERPDGTWNLLHRKETTNATHNHGPFHDPSACHQHRTLSPAQIELVHAHHDAGIGPKHTVAVLLGQPEMHIVKRDIYNIVQKLRRERRGGRAPPEALVACLKEEAAKGGIVFNLEQDDDGHIKNLFIADRRSIEYYVRNPDILLLDCTYRTNKFDMPMLDALGVDCMSEQFTVFIAFLDDETETNFKYALDQFLGHIDPLIRPAVIATDCEVALMNVIDNLFPPARTKSVLCYWHISKNVLTNCKAKFETEERWEEFMRGFRDVVYSKTEYDYEDNLDKWKMEFGWNDGQPHQPPQESTIIEVQRVAERELERSALVYCTGQWLSKYKEKVVHAWTDRYFNGNVTTTSRLEGAHRVLKSWIGGPSNDLTGVWEASKLAINDQLNEINQKRSRQLYGAGPANLTMSVYHPMLGQISHEALRLFAAQYDLVKREKQRLEEGAINEFCTGTYYSSVGIPCWHMIKCRVQQNLSFQPVDFHPHWHYERPPIGVEWNPPLPILDPVDRQRRRTAEVERRAHSRVHARLRTAQTGRILSQHEQREAPLRHCSACTEHGHDRATCHGCRSTDHTRSRCPFRQPSQ
jgi:hypothetical protein